MSAAGATGNDVSALQEEIRRLKEENLKLRASNRRWMRIAGTDALTGLPNKVFLSTALLPQQLGRADAENEPFACLIIAPDQLGDINQRFGRDEGDEVVRGLAGFLKENLGKGERLVHFDGANFVILIPGGDTTQARRKALALRARLVSRTFALGEETINLTISIGAVSRLPAGQDQQSEIKESVEVIVAKLVETLDAAKHAGRDNIIEATVQAHPQR